LNANELSGVSKLGSDCPRGAAEDIIARMASVPTAAAFFCQIGQLERWRASLPHGKHCCSSPSPNSSSFSRFSSSPIISGAREPAGSSETWQTFNLIDIA